VVRKETLAEAGRAMGLPDLIAVGPGERKERRHHHDSLVADAYEALVAAVYLDQGPEKMAEFLHRTLGARLAEVVAAPPSPDPKTLLQMRLQATGRGLPRYEIIEATGEGHNHHVVVAVHDADGVVLGKGEGRNRRTAERAGAEDALHHL
jgi:ribonuclease-3